MVCMTPSSWSMGWASPGDFLDFTMKYGNEHIRSAPFYSTISGQVKRMVRTTKDALQMIRDGDWNYRLDTFYRANQHFSHIHPTNQQCCSRDCHFLCEDWQPDGTGKGTSPLPTREMVTHVLEGLCLVVCADLVGRCIMSLEQFLI